MGDKIMGILEELDSQRLTIQEAHHQIMEVFHGKPDEVIEIELVGSCEHYGAMNWDRELEELR